MLSFEKDAQGSPQTYIVAQNPTVLAQLMRENECRPLNPSAYTTPASVFNTLAVDIDAEKAEPEHHDKPILPLKTIIIPAFELQKLDPFVDEKISAQKNNFHYDLSIVTANNQDYIEHTLSQPTTSVHSHPLTSQPPPPSSSPIYPIPCEIINAHYVDTVAYANKNSNNVEQIESFSLPSKQFEYPGNIQYNSIHNIPYTNYQPINEHAMKSRSLERNNRSINIAYSSRISSLERAHNTTLKQNRSNSLTRQMSAGTCNDSFISRSASLERSPRPIGSIHNIRANSLERKCQQQHQQQLHGDDLTGSNGHDASSFERNQFDLMKIRDYRGGSLDRNYPTGYFMVNRSASLERNTQYQIYRDQFKYQQQQQQQMKQITPESEPFQEEIYDFGGANVKSCASIALSKSISKGLLPPGTQLPQSQQCMNTSLVSPKTSGLPPPHNSSQLYSIQTQIKSLPINQPAMHPNSIYTPMFPRTWNNMSTSSASTVAGGGAHNICIQKPPINLQKTFIPSISQSYLSLIDSEQISTNDMYGKVAQVRKICDYLFINIFAFKSFLFSRFFANFIYIFSF